MLWGSCANEPHCTVPCFNSAHITVELFRTAQRLLVLGPKTWKHSGGMKLPTEVKGCFADERRKMELRLSSGQLDLDRELSAEAETVWASWEVYLQGKHLIPKRQVPASTRCLHWMQTAPLHFTEGQHDLKCLQKGTCDHTSVYVIWRSDDIKGFPVMNYKCYLIWIGNTNFASQG